MITRFYADNYKCLTNFEYKPKPFELIVGANGTGKSTVFEALDKIRRFVTGQADALELFPPSCGTRWDLRPGQIFEVDFQFEDRDFRYRLEINLFSQFRVEKEILTSSGGTIIESEWQEQKGEQSDQSALFSTGYLLNHGVLSETPFDDHTGQVRILTVPAVATSVPEAKVFNYLSDQNKSMLVTYQHTIPYALLENIHLVKLNPQLMTSQVRKMQPRPANDLFNFASYYLYILQQKQGKMFEMIPHLRDAIEGFDSFAVEEDFEEARRDLRVVLQRSRFKATERPPSYGFEELSDGQRALIGLYTLLFCTLEKDVMLVIDEPENYIALRELQPWLMLLQERLEEHGGQVILISHHPEFINQMAPQSAVQFVRDNNGPVRVMPFPVAGFEGLTPAEIMARGWNLETAS